MYRRLQRRKRRNGWHNLIIERRTVERLLGSDDWYQLTLPAERLNAGTVREVRRLEEIALDLLTEYADRFWRARRRRWEHARIEVAPLTQDDPNNVGAYEMTLDAARERLVRRG